MDSDDGLNPNTYVRVFMLLALWMFLAIWLGRNMGDVKNNETLDILWDENTYIDESDESWFVHILKYVSITLLVSLVVGISTITTGSAFMGLFPLPERANGFALFFIPTIVLPICLLVWAKDMINRGVSELLYLIWFITTGIIWFNSLLFVLMWID
jgi:hypothetical protein